ncbi:heterokaryon incompatibility protein het-6-like protein [Colletotrichum chrysophilum]|uniref:Heterokaryon incompatibility protein het-6-like protein n=1 Tax=Colletotrichum chrysophilum TaxID=1836956 RepID=A0AAD9B165_9PEZI|nr:heterokaryon incompatibility protein het-6-like protein [Colletotrichum chrysophilum]
MVLQSEYENADIRIAFDLKMLMSWAQLHPCTMAFRSLVPYCQNGENELALFLKNPLHEEANVMVPWWPQVVDDCFGVNKSACHRNIAVV